MKNDRGDIRVRAGADSYPVVFAEHRHKLARIAKDSRTIIIISNATVFALHGESFMSRVAPRNRRIIPLMIGDGERYKNLRTITQVYEHFFNIGVERSDSIIALGGGVVGDSAGFAAATFKRGVNFIQVPTTLLAMVDASVGGKVGVNHRRGKNQIGAFYHPSAVLIDPSYLATLGAQEMAGGLAEILKVGFLSSADMVKRAAAVEPEYSLGSRTELVRLIRSAIRFKAGIVERDERDRGVRRLLNFGHTFGHAIEAAEGFGRYRHGEAVLAGMVGALHLSHAMGYLRRDVMRKYLEYCAPLVARLRPLKKDIGDYVSPLAVDKKSRNRTPVFVLLERIGRPRIRAVASEARIAEAVAFMREFVNNRGKW